MNEQKPEPRPVTVEEDALLRRAVDRSSTLIAKGREAASAPQGASATLHLRRDPESGELLGYSPTEAAALDKERAAPQGGALKTQFQDALGAYWDCAHAEGKEGRDHDTADGRAQESLSRLLDLFDRALAGAAP